MVRPLSVALVLLAFAAEAGPASPEVMLCAQHLKASERDRVGKAVGGLETLPLYQAELVVKAEERTVEGRLQLQWRAGAKPLEALPLRAVPNAFGSGRLLIFAASVNGEGALIEEGEPGLYWVRFVTPVAPREQARIELKFRARVPEAKQGGGGPFGGLASMTAGEGGDFGTFQASPELISLVGVLPTVPPFDEEGNPTPGPSGMGDLALYGPANYLVAVKVPRGWQAFATGVAMGEVPEQDGTVRFSYAAAAVRDFPVFVGRGYQSATAKVGAMTIESHFLRADAKSGRKSLAHAVAAVRTFEAKLGPMPYAVLRLVEVPLQGGAGGMEFSGLVTLSRFLYGGEGNPLEAMGLPPSLAGMGGGMFGGGGMETLLSDTLEFTVVHELAHQYFPGIVGSDPIRNPAVDESLAQHLALAFLEWQGRPEDAEKMRKSQLQASYQLHRMMGGKDGVVDRPTGAFRSISEYTALVYGKAPFLHDRTRLLLGDEVYLAGLRAYLDEYRFKWACGDCLTRVLEKRSPKQAAAIRALRNRWWGGVHGDEDLGRGDLGSMMQGLTGQELSPEARELLEQLLPQLMGQE
jgi:hypothetical protein